MTKNESNTIHSDPQDLDDFLAFDEVNEDLEDLRICLVGLVEKGNSTLLLIFQISLICLVELVGIQWADFSLNKELKSHHRKKQNQ